MSESASIFESSRMFEPQSNHCPICGSNKLRRYKALAFDGTDNAKVSITECDACTFAWQYPFGRTEAQSAQFFENAYQDAGKTQSGYFIPDYKRDIAKLEFDFVSQLPVAGKRLLDIGAGAGIFAEVAANNGWHVTAVDPALDVARISNNENIRPIKGSSTDIPPAERFDVVTLWDVIEHTTKPMEVIIEAKNRVGDGGWLIIETGNFKSADRIYGGREHWMYQLDHRWYFSPGSMEKLMREAGFSQFVVSDKVLRPGWRGSAQYEGPSKRHLLNAVIRRPWRIPGHVSQYMGLLKAKSWDMAGIGIFAIAAKKTSPQ